MVPFRSDVEPGRSGARALAMLGLGLAVVAVSFGLFSRRVDAERREFVERRLRASSALLVAQAREVLAGRTPREQLSERMNDLGAATDLRITLISTSGEVIAESEVRSAMPNLADRPEVREATRHGLGSATRKSAMTGKETLYVAQSVSEDGKRLGTLRVATEAHEIEGVLGHLEFEIAAAITAALALGAWIGWSFTRRGESRGAPAEPRVFASSSRRAA